MNSINILGVRIDTCSEDEALARALELARSGDAHFAVTPNAEILRRANTDEGYRRILNAASLSLPDGIGVVAAAKLSGAALSRVAGVDFGARIISEAGRCGIGVYLLGGKAGVAERAAARLKESCEGIAIAGTHHGYFDKSDEVIADIAASRPGIVVVCLGAPRQERWVYENLDRLPPALYLCLGGSIDIYAGDKRRAPRAIRQAGLEWAWRIACEPSRIRRAGALPMFVIDVLRAKAGSKSTSYAKSENKK